MALIFLMDVALIHIDNPSHRALVQCLHELHILITLLYVILSQIVVMNTLPFPPLVSKSIKTMLHLPQHIFYILLVISVDRDKATLTKEVHEIFCYRPLANLLPFPHRFLDYSINQMSSMYSCYLQTIVSFGGSKRKRFPIGIIPPHFCHQVLFASQKRCNSFRGGSFSNIFY